MVDIFVGPQKQHFHVHKNPLCTRVPYFEKVFKEGGFLESVDQVATLPEDDPVAFSLLLEWVYNDMDTSIFQAKSKLLTGDRRSFAANRRFEKHNNFRAVYRSHQAIPTRRKTMHFGACRLHNQHNNFDIYPLQKNPKPLRHQLYVPNHCTKLASTLVREGGFALYK